MKNYLPSEYKIIVDVGPFWETKHVAKTEHSFIRFWEAKHKYMLFSRKIISQDDSSATVEYEFIDKNSELIREQKTFSTSAESWIDLQKCLEDNALYIIAFIIIVIVLW